MGKVTRQGPYTNFFLREEKGEPTRIEPRSFCLPAKRLTARPHRLTSLAVASSFSIKPTDPELNPGRFHVRRHRGLTFTWWGCYGLCFKHTPTELAHSFLFCYCVYFSFTALSTVFHSINSPNSSPLPHSVLPTLFLPYWSFRLYVSLLTSL